MEEGGGRELEKEGKRGGSRRRGEGGEEEREKEGKRGGRGRKEGLRGKGKW